MSIAGKKKEMCTSEGRERACARAIWRMQAEAMRKMRWMDRLQQHVRNTEFRKRGNIPSIYKVHQDKERCCTITHQFICTINLLCERLNARLSLFLRG